MWELIFLVLYNIPRVLLLKLRYGKRVSIHWMQRLSPCCALKLYGQGKLALGEHCQFPSGCDLTVLRQGNLTIGNRVIMNKYVLVSCLGTISIGNNCLIGPGVKIFDNNHRFCKDSGASQELSIGMIKIGNNCWIASNAVILKGANIGDNCVIGAGCIINGKIPSGSLVRPKMDNIIEPIHK